MGFLVATILLGSVFLGVKVVEYGDKFEHHHVPGASFHFEESERHGVPIDQRHAQMFFGLYFAMTGLHALHMIVGIGDPALAPLLGAARPLHARELQLRRGDRALLALRGHRVDLPLPDAVPDRAGTDERSTSPRSAVYVLVFLALMLGTAITVWAAFSTSGRSTTS